MQCGGEYGVGVGGDCLKLLAQGSSANVFLQPLFIAVLFLDSKSCQWRGTAASHMFHVAFVMSPVLFTVIRAVLFTPLYFTVKWKWLSSTY